MSPRRGYALAATSGLVFAASTPPFDFQPGILLGLILFAWALNHEGTKAWKVGLLFGLFANLEALRFVPGVMQRFTSLPAIAGYTALTLLALGQSVPWILGAVIARRLKWVPRWFAFGVGVYVATFVPGLFPWTPAGGLSRWPILIQTAEVFGERGTSLVIAIACAMVLELRVAPAAIFAVLLAYGGLRMHSVDAARTSAPHARIGLLQPDFDAEMRWDPHHAEELLAKMSVLTRKAEAEGAVLTVWPESGYPYALPHGANRSPLGARAILQPGVRGPVLTGAVMQKGGGISTNSAILVSSEGDIAPSYDKRHLLWFGETVPFSDVFPFLRKVFSRGFGIDPGTESIAFKVGPIVASVLNCYEDTLPAAGREAMEVTPKPNLLVNITNDAWFVGSSEGELHLRLATLRAIEARRDLVRSVNRGPTTWVDATGRVLARQDPEPTLAPPLVVPAALLEGTTLYMRFGDLPLIVLVILALYKARRAHSREGARPQRQ